MSLPLQGLVCLGEGITGKQEVKQEQMDPVALGKALECQRLRAGAAGVGSASCASARLLPDPGLGTERIVSQFLRSRKGFIFLGLQRTGAGPHWGSPARCSGGAGSLWNRGNVSSPLETSPVGWKFHFVCRPFLKELFGPRKSHICFVAKLYFGLFVSFWPHFCLLVFAWSRQLLQGVTWEGVGPSCHF